MQGMPVSLAQGYVQENSQGVLHLLDPISSQSTVACNRPIQNLGAVRGAKLEGQVCERDLIWGSLRPPGLYAKDGRMYNSYGPSSTKSIQSPWERIVGVT